MNYLSKKKIGKLGERIILNYLNKNGHQILEVNYFAPRWGEIDIISKKAETVSFFEVRTKTTNNFGRTYDSLTFRKRRSLERSIKYYIYENNLNDEKILYRLYLASVYIDINNMKAKIMVNEIS